MRVDAMLSDSRNSVASSSIDGKEDISSGFKMYMPESRITRAPVMLKASSRSSITVGRGITMNTRMPTTATAMKTSLLRVMSGRGPAVFDSFTSSNWCRLLYVADIRDAWRPVHKAIMHVSCREAEFCDCRFPELPDTGTACHAVNGRGRPRTGSPVATAGRSTLMRC